MIPRWPRGCRTPCAPRSVARMCWMARGPWGARTSDSSDWKDGGFPVSCSEGLPARRARWRECAGWQGGHGERGLRTLRIGRTADSLFHALAGSRRPGQAEGEPAHRTRAALPALQPVRASTRTRHQNGRHRHDIRGPGPGQVGQASWPVHNLWRTLIRPPKLIESESDNKLQFHVASLYPMLYRLERKGLVEGRWVEKAGERRCRFYRLTAQGRRALAQQRRNWREFANALNRLTRSEER